MLLVFRVGILGKTWELMGMARFTDKVAVVTGAGRGIGSEIAKAFAAEGGKVAVVSRSEGSCGAAADTINTEYPEWWRNHFSRNA